MHAKGGDEVVNWLFYLTINEISVIYMTAHRSVGGLEKVDLRSGSQRHRHFVGFFNLPVQSPTRGHPIYTILRNRPIKSPFKTRCGYGGHILDLTPPPPPGSSIIVLQKIDTQNNQGKVTCKKLEAQGPCTGHRSIIAILYCFSFVELSWIGCLTSQLTIFQSYMWRHIDVQADWRRSCTYGRAPTP